MKIEQVKKLREETGVSITECQKALQETNGDEQKAKDLLRKWGKDLANRKSVRTASSGIIETYVHPNKKVGVMLELKCESDFVAKSTDFQELAHEICLQIAAMNPSFLKEQDIPQEILTKEENISKEQIKENKPKEIIEKIIMGKIEKFKKENSLMSQAWIKDPEKNINDLITEYIGKIGENIFIEKFVRFEI
ncbi:MAG: elongation factor Ts [Candidatus Pacebacteria bacterium]|nr:elongation factor Ts [Candidatus Paceibacterota bacterium]